MHKESRRRAIKLSFLALTLFLGVMTFLKSQRTGQTTSVQSISSAALSAGTITAYPGPFIFQPDVLRRLDTLADDGLCGNAGPLAFPCLVQQIDDKANVQPATSKSTNPFNLSVTKRITETIYKDLDSFARKPVPPLYKRFLTDTLSRLELVGIVNRMDRRMERGKPEYECGEISVVYRFRYSVLRDNVETAASRVPVTMNVVFPAVPKSMGSRPATACKEVARRWALEMDRRADRPAEEIAADLTDPEDGLVALLNGLDIDRIELNMQVFRIPASDDLTDLGSSADYLIRVFRWNKRTQTFNPSYLNNQIDRARILGNPNGDENTCDEERGKPLSKKEFVRALLASANLGDIDSGSVIIDKKYLACRALSGSPGGAYRSKNNLFWNAEATMLSGTAREQVIKEQQLLTDREIQGALKTIPTAKLRYIRTAEDFRLRLSEQTCSGCHQARAIAGFHFPGSDSPATPPSNAVLLPGSPHFYGDQPRRMQIIKALASGKTPSVAWITAPYASRPDIRFKKDFENTQMIGGWGSTCLTPEKRENSARKWDCQAGLACRQLFKSPNAPGLGTCVPDGRLEIGDALQVGTISSSEYSKDQYLRIEPTRGLEPDEWTKPEQRNARDTRVSVEDPTISRLLPPTPVDNSYFGAHQEWYQGVERSGCGALSGAERDRCFQEKRDNSTGGFSAGMLRLSECRNLPMESTCALVASTGFNTCIKDVEVGKKKLVQCFTENTSYAGLRACDVSTPCRDDYICLRPLGYSTSNVDDLFLARRHLVKYDENDFGQKKPDQLWLSRNNGAGDARGVCIPPYFVFQFRSDGHPASK